MLFICVVVPVTELLQQTIHSPLLLTFFFYFKLFLSCLSCIWREGDTCKHTYKCNCKNFHIPLKPEARNTPSRHLTFHLQFFLMTKKVQETKKCVAGSVCALPVPTLRGASLRTPTTRTYVSFDRKQLFSIPGTFNGQDQLIATRDALRARDVNRMSRRGGAGRGGATTCCVPYPYLVTDGRREFTFIIIFTYRTTALSLECILL